MRAEANDVFSSVTVHVSQKPHMFVVAPTLVVAEVGDDEFDRSERAIASRQRAIDTGVTEADDVIHVIAVDVASGALVQVCTPTARVKSEISEHEGRSKV